MFHSFTLLASILFGVKLADAFYQGIHPQPQSFSVGDKIELKVNKLTSTTDLYPLDYYRFPFCEPEGGPTMDHQNLGELLLGDRIKSSPYVLNMKEDAYCRMLCVTDLGDQISINKETMSKEQRNYPHSHLIDGAIRRKYHHNWIIDDLPAARKMENIDSANINLTYWGGFPIGYISDEDNRSYIYNHVNIELMYYPVRAESNKFRIVRFTIEPFSILHSYKETKSNPDNHYEIINPIDSCEKGSPQHTSFDMIHEILPQPASGKVLFTYDVIWIENPYLEWAARWDIYLTMNNAIPSFLHWQSVTDFFLIVVVSNTFIAGLLVYNLRRDISTYNEEDVDEEKGKILKGRDCKVATDEDQTQSLLRPSWALIHTDVFRPPRFSLLLSVATGTGLQLLCTAFISICLSALGFINQSYRGSLLMTLIFVYAFMGAVSGYVTARIYKSFKGERWRLATTLAAMAYPGVAFIIFFLINLISLQQNTSNAVPLLTMMMLLVMWLGFSCPLVFLGAHLGYKKDSIEFPTRVNEVPRTIPKQGWWMHPIFGAFVLSLPPFLNSYPDLYFIMPSMWLNQYFNSFGVLFCVFIILIASCAVIAVVMTFLQLRAEDYEWWWRAFYTAGFVAVFFFYQSFRFFDIFETKTLATCMLYFGCMGLICLGGFLMTGSVGLLSALWFNKTIYGAIKPKSWTK